MKTFLFIFLFFFFSIGHLLSQVNSIPYTPLENLEGSEHMADKSLILIDKEKQWDAADIIDKNYDQEAVIEHKNVIPYMDFTSDVYWMQLNVSNNDTESQKFYIQLARPLTNQVHLYVYNENNELEQSFITGDDYVFSRRPFKHRSFIFPVEFSAKTDYKLVVYTESDGEILKLPMKFWRIDSFTEFNGLENFFLGLYYGLFILVIVLFSFFGIALRQNLYLYFVLYVAALGIFQFSLDGLAFQYFWSNNTWLGNHAILLFADISMIFMLLYVQRFLDFSIQPKYYQKIYYFFLALVLVCFLTSLSAGAIYAITFPVLNGLSFIIILYFIYGIILRYRAGDKPELAVSAAFGILCISSILFILSNVNLLENEFLASNALKLGSAAEVSFLSVAMASRYRKTQDEKIEA